MLSDITPHKKVGNLYFVGTEKASSHLIDTGDGLILIDVGYEHTADVVIESMGMLGFSLSDVKIILLSHGHSDHSAGAKKIRDLTGAKIYMFKEDIRYLEGKYLPDCYFTDGQIIKLGNTEILCLHTPGHTAGTASFFFDIYDGDKVYRAGSFGGASANQLRKPFLDKRDITYRMRGVFLESIERLKSQRVDVLIGNHASQDNTRAAYEVLAAGGENPHIDSTKWLKFLARCEKHLESVIEEEKRTMFVNYAHRGASAYMPENTLLSFYEGIAMDANGVETDVQRTKDGALVLYHDNTLDRLVGESGSISDYTFDELRSFRVEKNGRYDRIPTLEDFLSHFAFRDITFAIELKVADIEKDVADMLIKYDVARKTVVTSFELDYIKKFMEIAPNFRVGYLCCSVDEELLQRLTEIGVDEICPKAETITPDLVRKWHLMGFRVRAWGVANEELMRHAYDCGVDGMTVNFPDKLHSYILSKN